MQPGLKREQQTVQCNNDLLFSPSQTSLWHLRARADSGNEQWNAATQLFKSGDYEDKMPALISLESSYPQL